MAEAKLPTAPIDVDGDYHFLIVALGNRLHSDVPHPLRTKWTDPAHEAGDHQAEGQSGRAMGEEMDVF